MKSMSVKEFKSLKKGNKYGAKKCEAEGIKFDSLAEREYYLLLKADQDVKHIDVHPTVTLHGGIRYKPDFIVWYGFGGDVWQEAVEVKGAAKAEFRRLRKLFDSSHPLAPLKVVRKTRTGWEWI